LKRINELFEVEEDFKVLSLHSDSRYVGKDSVFFCIEGLNTDGHKYADDAVFQGAKCIVHEKPLKRKYPGVLYIQVADVMKELNRVANIFYDYPSYKMTCIGVTGTSGKTVVALMVKDVLNHYLKMGYIGTNDSQFGSTTIRSVYTTPETLYLHRVLSLMVKDNVKGVTIEASSHGLALHRCDSVDFDIAVFTNLYDEHLDFHGTLENLMKAKLKLFELVNEKGYCILNADAVQFIHYLSSNAANVKGRRITYGIDHRADIMAGDVTAYIDHTEFNLYMKAEAYHVSVPMLGAFNVPNLLAVIAVMRALEMPMEQIIEAMDAIHPIDGRMERLETDMPFHIIVDFCQYVHSYENVFKFARSVRGKGRIIAVFGTSGRRRKSIGRRVARLANEYCDQVILTEEDAWDEDVQELCEMMQEEITNPVSVIITNRRIAIAQAIELACADDIILLLGKGHEQYMASPMGNVPYPGDKFVALQAIETVFGKGDEDEI